MTVQNLSKYDHDFAYAMALKLRLNREQRNSQASEMSAQRKEQSGQTLCGSLRNLIIQNAMEDHLGLTEQDAQKMLSELGG